MAKDAVLQAKLQARDETRAALESSARGAEETARKWDKLDRAMQKAMRQRGAERARADQTLELQNIRNLEREAQLGSKIAQFDLQRARIIRQVRQEKAALLAITKSELTTDTQKAAAQRQLLTLERQQAAQIRAITTATREKVAVTSGAIATVKGLVGAYLGFAGVRMVLAGVTQSLNEMRDTAIAFEDELTELLSLGDNLGHIDNIKDRVLAMSDGWGIARKEIIDAMFNLQSSAGNLDQEIRDGLLQSSLELTRVYGGSLAENLNANIKLFQIYGKTQSDVTRGTQLLAATAERGALTLADLATEFPDMLSKAKAMSATQEEAAAAVIVTTQRLGKTNKTITATGNIFLAMNEAQKKGIMLTGTFTEKLEQLSKLDPLTFQDIFGRENIAAAQVLVSNIQQVRDEIEVLNGALPDVGVKLQARLADPAAWFAEMMKALRQAQENVYADGGMDPGLRQIMSRGEAAALGAKQNSKLALLESVGGIMAAVALDQHRFGSRDLEFAGFMHMAEEALKAGRARESSEYLALAEDSRNRLSITPKEFAQAEEQKQAIEELRRAIVDAIRQAGRDAAEASKPPAIAPAAPTLPTGADAYSRALAARAGGVLPGAGLPGGKLGELPDADEIARTREKFGAVLDRTALGLAKDAGDLGSVEDRIKAARLAVAHDVDARAKALVDVIYSPDATADQQRQARGQHQALVQSLPGLQDAAEKDVRDAETRRMQQARERGERQYQSLVDNQLAAELRLGQQKLTSLERMASLGDRQAEIDAEKLRIEQEYAQRRRDILELANDESLTEQIRQEARGRLGQLDQEEAKVLAHVGKAGGGGVHGGSLTTALEATRKVFANDLLPVRGGNTSSADPATKTATNTEKIATGQTKVIDALQGVKEAIESALSGLEIEVFGG